MRETLIYYKKNLHYLLSKMPFKDMLEIEKELLCLLEDDIELQAELVIEQHMKGKQL